jgi:hypothetical protein
MTASAAVHTIATSHDASTTPIHAAHQRRYVPLAALLRRQRLGPVEQLSLDSPEISLCHSSCAARGSGVRTNAALHAAVSVCGGGTCKAAPSSCWGYPVDCTERGNKSYLVYESIGAKCPPSDTSDRVPAGHPNSSPTHRAARKANAGAASAACVQGVPRPSPRKPGARSGHVGATLDGPDTSHVVR